MRRLLTCHSRFRWSIALGEPTAPRMGALDAASTFFDNAVYVTKAASCFESSLMGRSLVLADYSNHRRSTTSIIISTLAKRGYSLSRIPRPTIESIILEVDSETVTC